ncbi:anti-repressor SinI family protein [Oceanobacillus longus]|uniref:Anti-repressor SinI family protein n=1 Tax=Oceanobacillus longus TaxID=930120 RepID=A0ABV8GVL6_9BACI
MNNGGWMVEKIIEKVAVDEEWVVLIKHAKKIGISMDEIRQFLNDTGHKA